MNSRTSQVLQILLIALQFILIAIFWNGIPDRVAVGFAADGTPHLFWPKGGIFLLPGASLFTYLLVQFLPYIDPKSKVREFKENFEQIRLVFIILFTGTFLLQLFGNLDMLSSGYRYLPFFVILMFMVLGNFMGKLRPNYFIGIRTPWTLENETVWIKTHRLAGRIWVVASFITLFSFFIPNIEFQTIWFYVYIALIAGVPVIYSFVLFRKIKKSEVTNATK